MLRKLLAAILAAGAAWLPATGSEPAAEAPQEPLRPVNSAFMLSAGSSHLADTYLTPLKYEGWNAAFRYERMQAMKFNPDRWRQQLKIGVEANGAENPARNATMYYLNLAASWGMVHVWKLPLGFQLGLGGSTGVDLGVIYNGRNGNNPAAAKADWTVNVTGTAAWRFRLDRMPVTLRWQTTIPVTGIFFSPQYDELYYEIYLGNRSGLVQGAWWGNFFRWNNLVTADLGLGPWDLRLGFESSVLSTKANDIVTRCYNFSFVIGVSGNWFSLNPRHGLPSPETRIIYALY